MRGGIENICGCFPTGRHYPGIADRIASRVQTVEGLMEEYPPAKAWIEVPLVVIDFETTGRDAMQDRIVEIGAVLFDEGKVTGSHSVLINPKMPMPQEAFAVHGISDDALKGQPYFEQALSELLKVLEGRLPVAYNASFDRGFLREEVNRAVAKGGFDQKDVEAANPPAIRKNVDWVDPLVWARELLSELKSKKLTEVAKHLEISLENAHRATDDAEATGHVLYSLSPRMPQSYGELIRIQKQYGARQEAEFAARRKFWKK